jgi:hypothetical protein
MIACWIPKKPPRCSRFRRTGFTATLANWRSHGGSGRKPYAFPIEGFRRGFGEMSASSFAEMVSRIRSHFHRQQRACPLSSAQAPCSKRFSVLFREVHVDRRSSRNHSTTSIPYTEVVLLTSGGWRAALRIS